MMYDIKYDEFEEDQIAGIKNIIDAVERYFDGDVTKYYLEGTEKDGLAPRRFMVYFVRRLYNSSFSQLAVAFDTNFRGVFLDYNYIHEMVIKREEKFIKIVGDIENELGLMDDSSYDSDIIKYDETHANPEPVILEDENQFKLFDDDDEEEIASSSIDQTQTDNNVDYAKLIDHAIKARKYAYAPYSEFEVGAALLCADGEIYMGCNVENASYGLSNCAERTAIFKAISRGYKDFKAIAIVGASGHINSDDFDCGTEYSGCLPCGACLQVMSEFCHNDFEIILVKTATDYEVTTLGELMPGRFNLV